MHAYLAHHTEYLHPHHIKKCDSLRQQAVDGIALIVNWQNNQYQSSFNHLKDQLHTLFGPCFEPAKFLHSEVCRVKQPDMGSLESWKMFSEVDLSAFRQWFDQQRLAFVVDHTLISENGDVQIIMRDNHLLSNLRQQMQNLESDLPIDNINDEDLPLMSLDLGYFHDITSVLPSQIQMAEKLLNGWIFSHLHNKFYINRLELAEFRDETWQHYHLLDSFDSHYN